VLSPRVVLIVLDRSSKGEAPLVALTAKLSVKAPRSTVSGGTASPGSLPLSCFDASRGIAGRLNFL